MFPRGGWSRGQIQIERKVSHGGGEDKVLGKTTRGSERDWVFVWEPLLHLLTHACFNLELGTIGSFKHHSAREVGDQGEREAR
jgi:hypothetical protein